MEWQTSSPPIVHNFEEQPVLEHEPVRLPAGNGDATTMSTYDASIFIARSARARRRHGMDDPHHQHHFTTMEQQFDTSKIGMWLFLATEVLLFGGLFVGFGMMQARYPQEFVEAHEHLQRRSGALNTVVLLISSFTMVMGVLAARTNQGKKTARCYLSLTIVCACIFLGIKYFEYSHNFEEGLLPGNFYSASRRPDSDQGGSHGYATFFSFLFHDDRPARHPHSGRHRAAELARDPRAIAANFQQQLLHARRSGGPVLALGRFDLDLSVPAVLLDHMSTHTEHALNPTAHEAHQVSTIDAGRAADPHRAHGGRVLHQFRLRATS